MFEQAVANIVAKTKRSRDEARATLAASNPQGRLIDAAGGRRHRSLAGFAGGALNHRASDCGGRRRSHGRLDWISLKVLEAYKFES